MASPNRQIDLTKARAPAECHLMPCRIECTSQSVKAREFFQPTIRRLQVGDDNEQGREKRPSGSVQEDCNNQEEEEEPTLAASFRGRPLQGRQLKLPHNLKGHLVGREATKKTIEPKQFDKFTYWNWDQLPTKDDAVVKALAWFEIAKAIHDPVE